MPQCSGSSSIVHRLLALLAILTACIPDLARAQSLYGVATDKGDEAAILEVQKSLVSEPNGNYLWNWKPGSDPCGLDPLAVEQCRTCAWRGIFCL